jgi:predicted nuclease with TOPRIM domain
MRDIEGSWGVDMMTIDELDSRTRYLESEVEGEKAVTRHVLSQAGLNADDLGTLKTQVRHLTEQMVLVNAALSTHGNRLNVLTQDVTMLRQEVIVLRGEVNALRGEVTALRGEVSALRGEVTTLHGEVTTLRGEMDRRFGETDRRFDGLERNVAARFDTVERNIALILAAVVPPAPGTA